MERYTCSLSVDVTAPRLANLRSKYSTAPPKVARNPSRESAVLYSGLRRNSCNKIRKWILQLLDEKYRRRLHRAAYYLDTPPLRSSWNSVRFTTRNANRYLRIDTARWTWEINAGNSSPLIGNVRLTFSSFPPLPPGKGIASHQLGKFASNPVWTRLIGIQNLRFPVMIRQYSILDQFRYEVWHALPNWMTEVLRNFPLQWYIIKIAKGYFLRTRNEQIIFTQTTTTFPS